MTTTNSDELNIVKPSDSTINAMAAMGMKFSMGYSPNTTLQTTANSSMNISNTITNLGNNSMNTATTSLNMGGMGNMLYNSTNTMDVKPPKAKKPRTKSSDRAPFSGV